LFSPVSIIPPVFRTRSLICHPT